MLVEKSEKKVPTVAASLTILALIVAFMSISMIVFKAKLQTAMFFSWLIVIPYAMSLRFTFVELEEAAYDMMRRVMQPSIILLAVGAMIGSWILSGTVPMMIYIGLELISPRYFLVTTLLLCSIVSLATGTSWGTIGTAGLAMIGIGASLGIPAGITAGAIICGAYFGDKMSPISDSTNLAPAVSGAKLMPHIKHMCYTTGPSYIICMALFIVIGLKYGDSQINPVEIEKVMTGIASIFKLGFVPLMPAIIVIGLLLMGKPPVSSIMVGAVTGFLVAIFYQDATVVTAFSSLYSGYKSNSGTVFIDKLLSRGGIESMYSIIGLYLFALGLGGLLQKTGILGSILSIFSSRIKSVKQLLISTMIISYVCNCIGATISFAAVMTGTLMAPLYKEMRVKPENLSRIIEDCGTLAGPIIPWNTGAVYAAGALGVSPMEFIPYCFLSFINPVISLIYALTGFTITMENEDETNQTPDLLVTKANAVA